MNSWEPVLTKDLQDKAKDIMPRIWQKVHDSCDEQKDVRLITGLPGKTLFLSLSNENKFPFDDSLAWLLNKIGENIQFDVSLMNGIAGIGYVLKLIDDEYGIIDSAVLTQFYKYTRLLIKKSIYEGNHDLLHGYLGGCYFLLEDENSPLNFEVIDEAINDLKRRIIPQNKGVGWLSKTELMIIFPEIELSKIKSANLGMSHGSAGIIMLLSKLIKQYPQLMISHLRNEALDCLINEESPENKSKNGFYYSVFAGDYGKSYKGQLSWCYSDLGTSLMYFNLALMMQDDSLYKRADRIAQSCSNIKLENVPYICSGLCHGAAGVAHMFNRIFQITSNQIYKNAAIYWYSVLINEFLLMDNLTKEIQVLDFDKKNGCRKISNDFGFLEGLSGIGLSLMSSMSCKFPTWDKLLLMQ